MDDAALVAQYIESDPVEPGISAARLRGSGIAVLTLVRDLIAARGNVAQVAETYDIPWEAVVAARTFYLEHTVVIDGRIMEDVRQKPCGAG